MTRDPLGRHQFARLVVDLGYPAARLGRLEFGGRESWDAAFSRLTRPDRHRLLLELHEPLLTATPDGLNRLAKWRRDETPLPPMPSAEQREWIDWRLGYYGDGSLLPVVVGGLVACPEPVRDTVLRETAWLGVGSESRAWTSSARFVDRGGRAKTRVVLIGPNIDEDTVRHEAAHVWHSTETPIGAISTQGEAAVRQLARTDGWYQRFDEHEQRAERLADACAFAWGAESR